MTADTEHNACGAGSPIMTPIIDAIATHARARPAALACVDLESGRRWRYAELDRAVDRAAAWLVAELGPRSCARVGSLARNSGSLLVLHFAAARAGAVYAPFNWRLAPPEVAALIDDAKPAIVVHDAEFQVPCFDGQCLTVAEMEQRIAAAADRPPPTARRPADEVSTILYTSGTSGQPKGVISPK